MIKIGNNSRITQSVAKVISDKFTTQEFNDFIQWMKISKNSIADEVKQAKNKRF
jgi:DNA polymerase II small subunit/DNA polymerase delta subunit B